MDLIAKKRCYYRVWREPGERFTADRAHGRALVKARFAQLAPETTLRTYSTRAIPAAATERVVMGADLSATTDHITVATADDLKALRSQYRAEFGRPPHYTWSAEALREKLASS